MMLRVQQYDLIDKYRPGDQLHIAGTLSRASQLESTSQAELFEVHLLVQISKEKADEFKRETDSDPVLSKLKKVILTGWPENRDLHVHVRLLKRNSKAIKNCERVY